MVGKLIAGDLPPASRARNLIGCWWLIESDKLPIE